MQIIRPQNLCSMMLLVEAREGQRKSLSQKTDLSPDLSLELGTANIVVQTINGDSALHVEKLVRLVVRKITLQKNAGLIKAKAKARLRALVVPRNHSNIGKLM